MAEKEILQIFKDEKAYLTGHFLLSSGLHSPNYMQCAIVLQKAWIASKLCGELAKKFSKQEIDVVVGPALGGMLVSHEVGRALKVRSIFTERSDGQFSFRRGFTLKKNEKVLIVEDVITTGKSTYEVVSLVEQEGAKVVGIGALVDRSGGSAIFAQDFHSLLSVSIKSYRPEECPLCRERKVALVKPGSRPAKLAMIVALAAFLFSGSACWATTAQDREEIYDQARKDYRVYLDELKRLNEQYKEITGQMQKIVKEEGVPSWNGKPIFSEDEEMTDPQLEETANDMIVHFDLPGMDKKTIQVKMQDQRELFITGRRKTASGERVIERSFELPVLAKEKDVAADYHDGVLTVTVAKAESSPQEVSIPVN